MVDFEGTHQSLRALSKQLFGNIYRIEIAAALDDWGDEPVTALQLADFTGVRYPRVQEELKRLAAARLLVERQRSGLSVEYKIVPSAYWPACSAVRAEHEGGA